MSARRITRRRAGRRQTYASVQPDQDLAVGRGVGRREEPEVELVLGRVAQGHQPGVRLAHVEVDVGNGGAVDDILYISTGQSSLVAVGPATHSRDRGERSRGPLSLSPFPFPVPFTTHQSG